MKTPLLKLYGKRNGNLVTPYTTEMYINEERIAVGHIVELQGRLLECIGHRDSFMFQPSFHDVTAEISANKFDELEPMDIRIIGMQAVQP